MHALWELFLAFARVGVFGYGGGPSMLPLIEEEVVRRNRWMTIQEYTDALAFGNALPGPIATKMSAYTGYKIAGIPGAVAGTLGVVLPSVLMMLALAVVYFRFRDHPRVEAVLRAVRPAVVALLVVVVWDLAPPSLRSPTAVVIALLAFLLMVFVRMHPAIVIGAAALVGLFLR
jgi:chromate transporter